MKVALVHSYYSAAQPSGENVVVDMQAAALRASGIEVEVVSLSTDRLAKHASYKATSALQTATGVGRTPLQQLRSFAPDVVHVHNLFPNFGSRWANQWEGPLVSTLHNFRPLCASGTLFREGHDCVACPTRGSVNAVIHRCYRGSRIASIPLAISSRGGASHNPLLRNSSRLVTLSERARQRFVTLAPTVRTNSVRVIPNFVEERRAARGPRSGFVYVGRLAPEKGLVELVSSWPAAEQLTIIGAGPLDETLRSLSRGLRIRFLGVRDRDEIAAHVAAAEALVFPSRWQEPAPAMAYVEALSGATPVLSTPGHAVADDVQASGSGIVYETTHLSNAISTLRAGWPAHSAAAQRRYKAEYSESKWVSRMTELYEEVA